VDHYSLRRALQAVEWRALPPPKLAALVDDFTDKVEASIAAEHREADLWERVWLRRATSAKQAGQIGNALSALASALQRPITHAEIDAPPIRISA